MAISFNEIGTDLRIPFVAVEIDSSRSAQGPALLAYQALLIGQLTASGDGTANTITRVTTADEVGALAGRDSHAFMDAKAWFANNKSTPLHFGLVADNGSGVAASGTITVTGPATADGTLHLYIAGTYVPVGVSSGDAATTIAAAIETAFDDYDLPVTASATDEVVTVTAVNKGTVGNGLPLRVNYQVGQSYPAGVSVAIVAMASGATNPDLSSLISAMGDDWYHIIAHPYTDATTLTALETELSSRFSSSRMIDGVAFTSSLGTIGTLSTLGASRNSQHSAIVAQSGSNPVTSASAYGAAVAAVAARYGAIDPARPLQTLPLAGVLPASGRFTDQERNSLLFTGIATTAEGSGGVAKLDRMITTYQTNAAGGSDTAYLDVATMLTLMYLRYSFRARILSRYPRHKLADDGTRFGAGQAVITPLIGKAEAVSWFLEMQELGLVEGLSQFKRDLLVERNTVDRNRLDFLLPPDLINQLVVTAAQIQFLI